MPVAVRRAVEQRRLRVGEQVLAERAERARVIRRDADHREDFSVSRVQRDDRPLARTESSSGRRLHRRVES